MRKNFVFICLLLCISLAFLQKPVQSPDINKDAIPGKSIYQNTNPSDNSARKVKDAGIDYFLHSYAYPTSLVTGETNSFVVNQSNSHTSTSTEESL